MVMGGVECREMRSWLRLYWGSGDEGVVAMVADVGVVGLSESLGIKLF